MNDFFIICLVSGQVFILVVMCGFCYFVVVSGWLWLIVIGGVDDYWLLVGEGLTLVCGKEVVVEVWFEVVFQLLQFVVVWCLFQCVYGWCFMLVGV